MSNNPIYECQHCRAEIDISSILKRLCYTYAYHAGLMDVKQICPKCRHPIFKFSAIFEPRRRGRKSLTNNLEEEGEKKAPEQTESKESGPKAERNRAARRGAPAGPKVPTLSN